MKTVKHRSPGPINKMLKPAHVEGLKTRHALLVGLDQEIAKLSVTRDLLRNELSGFLAEHYHIRPEDHWMLDLDAGMLTRRFEDEAAPGALVPPTND